MRKLFFLFYLIVPIVLFGQTNSPSSITISGKIIDTSTKAPIDYATVIFKSIDSGSIKYGGITNQRGHFSIEIIKGTYITTIEFVSYKTKKLTISEFTQDIDIGIVEMEVQTENLEEIKISESTKALNVNANKLVFNVSNDVASESKMTFDMLNIIPSISIDPVGGITLNGIPNPTILINGKVTALSKADALKTLPASSIDKVEVISNPGASYQATSTGVINIILKKGKEEGFHTSTTVSGGYKDYYGALVNLNYTSDKSNIYFYPSYSHKKDAKDANTTTSYFNNDIIQSYLNRKSYYESDKSNFSGIFGGEFNISSKSTLSATMNYTNINTDNSTATTAILFDPSNLEIGNNDRILTGEFNNEIIEATVSLDHYFKTEDRILNAYITFSNDMERYDNTIVNSNSEFTNESYIENNNIKNYRSEIKYGAPINDSSNFLVGYYGEFGEIPFHYISENYSEDIHYDENIHAIFGEYEKIIGDFYMGLSLRAELSDVTINFQDIISEHYKNYNNLFPAVYFDYMFNDNENITLSYSKKIGRPSYSQLYPFEQKYTETWSFQGNINLDPVYYHMMRFSYTLNNSKFTLAPSLFFNRYNDYWQRVTYETGEQIEGINKLITTPENVGYVNNYGVDITAIYAPTKWLNFTGYLHLNIFDQHGVFETINSAGDAIHLDYTSTNFGGSQSLLTKIKIPQLFDFQVNVKHELLSQSNFSERKAYTYASLAINRDFWNNSASLSFTSNDLFNSFKTKRDRFDEGYYSKGSVANKYPTYILSFTYRFNQHKHDRNLNFDKKDIKPEF